MRNGTRFNNFAFNKLTLVDSAFDDDNSDDDAAAHYPYLAAGEMPADAEGESRAAQRTFLVFLTISVACAAATVVTGSYAVWLARHQAARRALTDVNEILRSCQSRMSQLESDLQRLPSRQG